jgi:photosystem II stability/assembly factor-like uncharacterized protein
MPNYLPQIVVAGVTSLCSLVAALPTSPAFGGTNRWTAIGPDAANVAVLAIVPSTASTLFAGTDAGVLKSTDGGQNWAVTGAVPTGGVSALAIDPATPATLFAGTSAGVFRSDDGGQLWIAVNAGLGDRRQVMINGLAFDSDSPAALYAVTSGGVFKTNDGGANWTSINAGLAGLTPTGLALDPTAPATLYLGVFAEPDPDCDCGPTDAGVLKSTDAGASWTRIYTSVSFPGSYYGVDPVRAISIDPRSPSRLYLTRDGGDLLRSADGGASWSTIDPSYDEVTSLAIEPASPATLYAGTSSGTVFRSTDAGDHWTPMTAGSLSTGPISVVAVAATVPSTVYVGGPSGISRNAEGGQTWTRLNLGGLRNAAVDLLAVDPVAPSTIYTTAGGVIIKTTDGGAHWVDAGLGVSGGWVNSLWIDAASPSTLYAEVAVGLNRSTDGGAHWAPLSNGLPTFTFNVQALAIAPSRSSTLYVTSGFAGVSKSVDGGLSWARVNDGLTAVTIFTSAVAVDPTNADIVYVAATQTANPVTDAIFKSTDGAATWRQLPIAFPNGTIITSLAIDPATPSTLYAAYGNHSAEPHCSALSCGGVFKSTDSGGTWAAAQDGLPTAGDVRALTIDPSSPSTIYAVTQTGVFRSTDAATMWAPFNSGLPSLLVSSVAIDRTGTLLRAATAGGLFEYQVSANGIGSEGNHTGMWWASPPGSESGWGINFAHQGDTVFATWFTFGLDGNPLWLIAGATKTAPNVYSGRLFTATGPAFSAVPFDPNRVISTDAGTATFTFADGNNATFAFTVSGVSQTKQITREVFAAPGTVCQ